MGYYTNYSMTYDFKDASNEDGFDTKQFHEMLADKTEYEFDYYDGTFSLNAKWYDWEADMIEISKTYPDMVFYLSGEGEEKDDIWEARFYNGKCDTVYAQITMPDFPPL